MNKIERLERLVSVYQLINTEAEELHMLAYLIQAAAGFNLDQVFAFHCYKVYSPTIGYDLQLARQWGLFENTYSLPEESCNMVKLLIKQSPAVLNVLSTIVYLNNTGYSKNKTVAKLNELKSNFKPNFAQAISLAGKLF